MEDNQEKQVIESEDETNDNEGEQNTESGNTAEAQAALAVLEVVESDPLLALLTDLKLKEQLQQASEEEKELLDAVENQLNKFIQGEAMQDPELKQETNSIANQQPEERLNNALNQMVNLFSATHQPKEGYEGVSELLSSPDREKHIEEAKGSLGEGASDLDIIKAAASKFAGKKEEPAVANNEGEEEENIGKNLNPSNKKKPPQRSIDVSRMNQRDYKEFIARAMNK